MTYVELTYMLHYRIHVFLLFLFEWAAMKTKDFVNIWKAALATFAPSNYVPAQQKTF